MQIGFHKLAFPPNITAMIGTGRILLLSKDEPINKQKIKIGAVGAQHPVGRHKYSFNPYPVNVENMVSS
jgi:hypothetical protein